MSFCQRGDRSGYGKKEKHVPRPHARSASRPAVRPADVLLGLGDSRVLAWAERRDLFHPKTRFDKQPNHPTHSHKRQFRPDKQTTNPTRAERKFRYKARSETDAERNGRRRGKTHPAELAAAVAALGRGRELFDVVVAEDAARGLDDASAVRRRVVRLALAEGDTLGHCGDFWAGKSTSASTSETEVW